MTKLTTSQLPVASPEVPTPLLPCPSCGSAAEYVDDFYLLGEISAIACIECSFATVALYGLSPQYQDIKKKELIANWNTRKPI